MRGSSLVDVMHRLGTSSPHWPLGISMAAIAATALATCLLTSLDLQARLTKRAYLMFSFQSCWRLTQ